jgi:hypothetical protein
MFAVQNRRDLVMGELGIRQCRTDRIADACGERIAPWAGYRLGTNALAFGMGTYDALSKPKPLRIEGWYRLTLPRG